MSAFKKVGVETNRVSASGIDGSVCVSCSVNTLSFPQGQQPRGAFPRGMGQQANFRPGMMPRARAPGADFLGQRLLQMRPQMGTQIQQMNMVRQQTVTNSTSWGSPAMNVRQTVNTGLSVRQSVNVGGQHRMNIISQAQQLQTHQIQANQLHTQQIRVQQIHAQTQQLPSQQVVVQQISSIQNNQIRTQQMQHMQSHFQNMARSLSGQPGTLPVSSPHAYQPRNASVWRCPSGVGDKQNRPPSSESSQSHGPRKDDYKKSSSSAVRPSSENVSRSSSSRDRSKGRSEKWEYKKYSHCESLQRKSDDRRNRKRGKKRKKYSDKDDTSDDEHSRRRTKSRRKVEGSRGSDSLNKDDEDFQSDDKFSDEEFDETPLESEEPAKQAQDDTPAWIRCSPADLYFVRDSETGNLTATKKMSDLEDKFEQDIVKRAERAKESRREVDVEPPPPRHHKMHMHFGDESDSDSSNDDSDEDTFNWLAEMNRKKRHPHRLHDDLWHNDPGELNDGPLCRCSMKARKSGIRHDIYPGEEPFPLCKPNSNNKDRLYHYRVTMSPATNFLTKTPTIIEHDSHEYIFEGFSLFSHYEIEKLPDCKVIRYNIPYTILYCEETFPENFTIRSLDLFTHYLFNEILEMVDMNWKGDSESSCNRYHLMPRFVRSVPDNGKEILSINEVLSYTMKSAKPLVCESELSSLIKLKQHDWENFMEEVRGMIVTNPGMKPCSVRVDQLDREQTKEDAITYPVIIHIGVRPSQLSYAGDPEYQKAWKHFVKYRHLLFSKPRINYEERQKLEDKELNLMQLRLKGTMKREVTVEVSSEGFIRTGIRSDIPQHALLLPVLLQHLRTHKCLHVLEELMGYKFKEKELLQLALTHTSYRIHFGTNPDHARNSLNNCGIRNVEYGDKKVHYVHRRKRGINVLLNIMSRFGNKTEKSSDIPHNERLEFLGDAVIEFLSSVHLFYMFPQLEEGALTSYRAAIVQNQHLSVLAKKLRLQDFMLYTHGPDLCHELNLKNAMANCFEAIMSALYIDGGMDVVDQIFGKTLFEEPDLLKVWMDLPRHPLQNDEPNGDRHWIESSPALQKLVEFEDATGIEFECIRLLAKSFTLRNVGYNILTMGHNQRLEFLGDTVLNLVASDFLFRHFPSHHEGHLSLLRSSLVNSKTQSILFDDLGMTKFVIYVHARGEKIEMKTKEKADVLEAFIGALYVDQGLEACTLFCDVCFFPRLKYFILNQDWNDPKSQLQQCCLTLREVDGTEPDIPIYKVIQSKGPTNKRTYTVAVYFRGERLATGIGLSIQSGEMDAATNALNQRQELFPILDHQKRFVERRYNDVRRKTGNSESTQKGRSPNKRSPGWKRFQSDHNSGRNSSSSPGNRNPPHRSRKGSRSESPHRYDSRKRTDPRAGPSKQYRCQDKSQRHGANFTRNDNRSAWASSKGGGPRR